MGYSAWLHYNHYNQNLDDSERDPDADLAAEEARRRAINPFLGGKPHTLSEDQESLDEAVSGSAWMFYNHYNPELTQAMQRILVGEQVADVVSDLVEGKLRAAVAALKKKMKKVKPALDYAFQTPDKYRK